MTGWKGGSELSSPPANQSTGLSTVLELSWLLNYSQSLQSFGSGCLQLSKTLPRHGSGINTSQGSLPVGSLVMAALSER